jgi:succinate-semialdehyde dehydrogenase/glutarate-semialdehyde dehydrogenase
VKPAERTPLCALAVCALAEQAGIPAGVVNVVTGDAEDAPVIGYELTTGAPLSIIKKYIEQQKRPG